MVTYCNAWYKVQYRKHTCGLERCRGGARRPHSALCQPVIELLFLFVLCVSWYMVVHACLTHVVSIESYL